MAADLQVKTSPRPQSRLALEVVIPAERCQRSYDKALRNLCRTVRLPGFRPGRIPQAAVLQQVGNQQVWITALEQLLEETIQDLLNDEGLDLLGKLQLQDSFDALARMLKPGESLTVNMEADVRPHATLTAYRDLDVEVEKDESSAEDKLEAILQDKRRSAGAMVPLERTTAQMGDVATIKLLLPPPDEPDEGGSAKPRERQMDVDLEEDDQAMAAITSLIVGMTVGETRPIPNATSGEDANGEGDSEDENNGPDQQVLDQDEGMSRLSVTLCGLKERQLPELDDAFARKVSRFSTLAELKDALIQEIHQQIQDDHKADRQEALLTALCEGMAVELPESLVEQETEVVTENFRSGARRMGLNPDLTLDGPRLEEFEKLKREETQRRLHNKLALEAVARAEQLTVADTELDERVQELRKQFKAGRDHPLDTTRLRAFVKRDLLREKALAWLEENNTFTVKGQTSTAADGEKTPEDPLLEPSPATAPPAPEQDPDGAPNTSQIDSDPG